MNARKIIPWPTTRSTDAVRLAFRVVELRTALDATVLERDAAQACVALLLAVRARDRPRDSIGWAIGLASIATALGMVLLRRWM